MRASPRPGAGRMRPPRVVEGVGGMVSPPPPRPPPDIALDTLPGSLLMRRVKGTPGHVAVSPRHDGDKENKVLGEEKI